MEMDIAARTGEYKGEGRRCARAGDVRGGGGADGAARTDQSLVGYLKLTQDITQRKRADAEREDMLRQAEAARADADARAGPRTTSCATISHELRTPLGRSSASAHLLERGGTRPTSFRARIEAIRRNAQVQVRLIEDLLDTARSRPATCGSRCGRGLAAVSAASMRRCGRGRQRHPLDAMLEQGPHLVMVTPNGCSRSSRTC